MRVLLRPLLLGAASASPLLGLDFFTCGTAGFATTGFDTTIGFDTAIGFDAAGLGSFDTVTGLGAAGLGGGSGECGLKAGFGFFETTGAKVNFVLLPLSTSREASDRAFFVAGSGEIEIVATPSYSDMALKTAC